MTEVASLAKSISDSYGTIKRARGPFLYTAKGVRLTDLYQEGGRAILGWGGTSAFTILKNVLSRGITGSFDTDYAPKSDGGALNSQLSIAVSNLLASKRSVYLYPSKQSALHAALLISKTDTNIYRPWNSQDINWKDSKCVLIQPPLAWAEDTWILAVRAESEEDIKNIAASGIDEIEKPRVASPLAAAFTRSIYDLIKALQERQEKQWFIYDTVVTKYWTRKGPYLYPKISEEKYKDFVAHCLSCELVISPDYNTPSIVPFGADKGVFRKLEKNPF